MDDVQDPKVSEAARGHDVTQRRAVDGILRELSLVAPEANLIEEDGHLRLRPAGWCAVLRSKALELDGVVPHRAAAAAGAATLEHAVRVRGGLHRKASFRLSKASWRPIGSVSSVISPQVSQRAATRATRQ